METLIFTRSSSLLSTTKLTTTTTTYGNLITTTKSFQNISSSAMTRRYDVYYRNFTLHIKHSGYYPIEFYLSYYSLFLIILGSICNLTSFLIMMRKQMRKHPCMRYLAMLSLTDAMVLYQWNMNTFYKYHLTSPPLNLDLEEISLFWCRWLSYMAFSCLQLSAWLLALVSFDRLMIVYSTCWTQAMNKSSKINLLIISLVVTIFTINSHILVKNGYVTPPDQLISNQLNNKSLESNNQSISILYHYPSNNNLQISGELYSVTCYKAKDDPLYIFPKWERAHLIIYNAVPFAIMLICNSLIIYNLKFNVKVKSKSKGTSKRKRRMTLMLVVVTFSFMTLTLPSVIVHSFLRDFLMNKPYRRFVNLIVNNLLHTSHAINFFFYILSAPNFRIEFLKSLKELKRFYETTFGINIRSRANSSTATTNISTRHKSSIKTNKSLNLNDLSNQNLANNHKKNINELNEKLSNGTVLDANKVRKKLIKFNTANSTTNNNSLTSNNNTTVSTKHKNKIAESNGGNYYYPQQQQHHLKIKSEIDYDEEDDEEEEEDEEDVEYEFEDDEYDDDDRTSSNIVKYEVNENAYGNGNGIGSRKSSQSKRNSRSKSIRNSQDFQGDKLVEKFIDSSTIN